jgi:hypothetical protein
VAGGVELAVQGEMGGERLIAKPVREDPSTEGEGLIAKSPTVGPYGPSHPGGRARHRTPTFRPPKPKTDPCGKPCGKLHWVLWRTQGG